VAFVELRIIIFKTHINRYSRSSAMANFRKECSFAEVENGEKSSALDMNPNANGVLYSFILCTYGEKPHINRLLDSLLGQGRGDFEVIIVDQNLVPLTYLIERYSDRMAIRLIRSIPGLSAARNLGIKASVGSILAFPDDDCWYPTGLLDAVEAHLGDTEKSGFTCKCTDEFGRVSAGSASRVAGFVTKKNVWSCGVSATMFIKRAVFETIGGFDEDLGLGAKSGFGSGEETDFLLRAVSAGYKVYYDAHHSVYHPIGSTAASDGAVLKAYSYGMGMGRVLRTHRYSHVRVAAFLILPIFGALAALLKADLPTARIRYSRVVGRYRGWR
jgi:GT2 family glycosyltransferase